MSLRKQGLRISLGMVAVLSMMALSASAAQASWLELIGGVATLVTGLLKATGEVDLLGVLEVPALSVELDCTGFVVKKGEILGNGHANGSNIAHLELLYTNCDAYGTSPTLSLQAACQLYETSLDREMLENEGNITASALVDVILHNGVGYLLALGNLEEPEKVLSRIWSRNCTGVPNGLKVKGDVTFELHEGGHKVKHLITRAPSPLFTNNLVYGTNSAVLLGSVWVELESGNPWGIC